MPGRVRFSSANTFHSPPPPLMGPSSSSSGTSSLGPLTPPPLPYPGLPGPTPFVPRYSYYPAKPIARPHALIAFSPALVLNYGISLPPSSISALYIGISSAGLLEPAVYPPEPSLTLVTPHLPWSIVVPAVNNGRFVTVSDVLHAVHFTLRIGVTQAEWRALGTPKLMHQASEAYRRRCERLRGHRGYMEEKRQGVKCVDFLMGYTKFLGILPTSRASDVWQLNIS
ncbi:hypothetical protein B0H13DRAFT_1620977 [Mycena leptocephala]|nr:hypothetical protein B0H13DRAFT_1620977 [Mycena leptocephala]